MKAIVNGIEINGEPRELVQFAKLFQEADTHIPECTCLDCMEIRNEKYSIDNLMRNGCTVHHSDDEKVPSREGEVKWEEVRPACFRLVHIPGEYCEHCNPLGSKSEEKYGHACEIDISDETELEGKIGQFLKDGLSGKIHKNLKEEIDIVCTESYSTFEGQVGLVKKGSRYSFDADSGHWFLKSFTVDTKEEEPQLIMLLKYSQLDRSKFVNVE